MKRQPATACIHFWQVASANGPLAAATCKRCGATASFNNGIGGCIPKGTPRSSLMRSWLAQGRAVRAAADPQGASLAQEAEDFRSVGSK